MADVEGRQMCFGKKKTTGVLSGFVYGFPEIFLLKSYYEHEPTHLFFLCWAEEIISEWTCWFYKYVIYI